MKTKRVAWNKGIPNTWYNPKGLALGRGWNRGTKGVMKPNSTSFQKGEHRSPATEFTQGQWVTKTTAHLLAISAANRGKPRPQTTGSRNSQWKGGITKENHSIRGSLQMKDWRRQVFTRDNYTCQACGVKGKYLHADHELPFALFPAQRFEVLNGRTLCKECHYKIPQNNKHWLIPTHL